MNNNITYIAVDKLRPHPQNPRKQLGDLTELADSIRANGVYQNLTVVENGHDTYTIIIGHRRHAAAKLAGLDVLPCVVVDMTMRQQYETMLLENMQRADLTIPEEAHGLQLLIDLGDSVAEIAASTGFSKAKIKSRLRLNKYDAKTVEQAFERGATLEDYAELDKIKDEKIRLEVAKELGTNNFSYKLRGALDRQRWEEEKPKIILYIEAHGGREVKAEPNWDKRARYNYVYSMKDVESFFEAKTGDRDVKYKIYDGTGNGYYSRYIGVYEMKTADELEKKQTPQTAVNSAQDKRRKFREHIDELIKGFEVYIKDFIISFDERAYFFGPGATGRRKDRTMARLITTMGIESYSSDELDYCPNFEDAFDMLDWIAEDSDELLPDIETRARECPVRLLLALMCPKCFLDECCTYYPYSSEAKKATFNETYTSAKRAIDELSTFGLQIPDELRQFLDGTHPIYTEEGFEHITAAPSGAAGA